MFALVITFGPGGFSCRGDRFFFLVFLDYVRMFSLGLIISGATSFVRSLSIGGFAFRVTLGFSVELI